MRCERCNLPGFHGDPLCAHCKALEAIAKMELDSPTTDDLVHKPAHYQTSLGVEVIDIIDEFFADNYNLGNVLKYLLRADKKGYRQRDLEKALVYLTREVKRGE